MWFCTRDCEIWVILYLLQIILYYNNIFNVLSTEPDFKNVSCYKQPLYKNYFVK